MHRAVLSVTVTSSLQPIPFPLTPDDCFLKIVSATKPGLPQNFSPREDLCTHVGREQPQPFICGFRLFNMWPQPLQPALFDAGDTDN